jgi:hypothetical protein
MQEFLEKETSRFVKTGEDIGVMNGDSIWEGCLDKKGCS